MINRCALLVACVGGVAAAQNVPPGFVDSLVRGGWNQAVGVVFAEDGRAFVWEKAGRVWMIHEGETHGHPVIDISEDAADIEHKKHKVRLDKLDNLDMVAYRNRVTKALQAIIDKNETLRKIRQREPVTDKDLEDLCSLVLTQEPGLDLHHLTEYYQQAKSLDQAIREIIGLDASAVQGRFVRFVHSHPNLASHQIKFLDLLQNHIARYGSIKTDDLYEPPFTTLHSDSLDGLFEEPLADELFEIIGSFQQNSE